MSEVEKTKQLQDLIAEIRREASENPEIVNIKVPALAENLRRGAKENPHRLAYARKSVERFQRHVKSADPAYRTKVFQCNADYEACAAGAKTYVEKALCLALFALCILRG